MNSKELYEQIDRLHSGLISESEFVQAMQMPDKIPKLIEFNSYDPVIHELDFTMDEFVKHCK